MKPGEGFEDASSLWGYLGSSVASSSPGHWRLKTNISELRGVTGSDSPVGGRGVRPPGFTSQLC